MTANHDFHAIESCEAFCKRISNGISSDGFDVSIQPGDHLVDDAGADSLVVLTYVSLLQDLGLKIDLSEFDANILNIDFAYQEWLQKIATQCQGEA